MDRYKGVGSYEDDSYSDILKDFSKFLIESRNMGNIDKNIFLNF